MESWRGAHAKFPPDLTHHSNLRRAFTTAAAVLYSDDRRRALLLTPVHVLAGEEQFSRHRVPGAQCEIRRLPDPARTRVGRERTSYTRTKERNTEIQTNGVEVHPPGIGHFHNNHGIALNVLRFLVTLNVYE